jgi:hypothetical protein
MVAMPRMIKELSASPSLGFLGAQTWFGRTTLLLQYWESFDKLEAYAKAKDHAHLPAWRDFNRSVGSSGEVGIWHETYVIAPGQYEAFYGNMPSFGLGTVGPLVAADGSREAARNRLERAGAPRH